MTDDGRDPVGDELRRRGRAARAEVERLVDLDASLTDATTSRPMSRSIEPQRPRTLGWIAAIAAVAVAVVGGVVLLRDSDAIVSVDPATTTDVVSTTAVTPSPTVGTEPAPTTTAVEPEVTVASTEPPDPSILAVDAGSPPPPADLLAIGSVSVEPGRLPDVAVGDLGIAVNQRHLNAVTVVGFDGSERTTILADDLADQEIFNVVYGPGDVLYAIQPIGPPFDFEMVAIPLSGDLAGTIVARSDPLGSTAYVELPPSPFGHGSDGIVDRARNVGATLMPYVDIAGDEIPFDGAVPHFPTVSDDLVVSTDAFGVVGRLAINGVRAPQDSYAGPVVPAPSNGLRTVYATHLGPTTAEQPPQPPVIAVLEWDGTGAWYSIADGYEYLASDSSGTVFGRVNDSELELAMLSGGPVNWRSLRSEDSGIDAPCAACTQILIDRDGTAVTFDVEQGTLTRHSTPPLSARVSDDLVAAPIPPFLSHLGPDGVVYLGVYAAARAGDDLAVDIVAISLASDDAGHEVGRWVGVLGASGDSELVATRNGLVVVSCCGPDVERPSPDAEVVVPWLDRSGEPVQFDGPLIRVEIDHPTLTVHRDDTLPAATRSWEFEPGADWQPRGMPNVIPTSDGGFIAATFHGSFWVITRGQIDGTLRTLTLDLVGIGALTSSGGFLVENDGTFAHVEPFDE